MPQSKTKKVSEKRVRSEDQKEKHGVHVFLGAKDYPRWSLIKEKSGCKTNVEFMRWLLAVAEKYFGIHIKEDIKTEHKRDPGLSGDSNVVDGEPCPDKASSSDVKDDQEPLSIDPGGSMEAPRAKRKATRKPTSDMKTDGDPDSDKAPMSDIKDDQEPGTDTGTGIYQRRPTEAPRAKRKASRKPISNAKPDDAPRTKKDEGAAGSNCDDSTSVKDNKVESLDPSKSKSVKLTKQKKPLQKALRKPNGNRNTKGPQKRKIKESQSTPKEKKIIEKTEEETNMDEEVDSNLAADSKLSRCSVRLPSLDKEELTKIGKSKGNKALPSRAQQRKIAKSKETQSPRELRAVARAKASAKLFQVHQCSICSKTFSNKANLKRHSELHSSKRYTCQECGKSCKSSAQLWAHKHRVHVQKYECQYCQKKFGLASLLAKHERCHTKEKPFECKECHKSFASLQMLNDHAECHNVGEPYLCHLCGMAFKRRDVLNHHVRKMHDSSEIFKCKLCDKSYKHRESLTNHMEFHKNTAGGTSPYTCHICNKLFKTSKGLKGHVSRHNKNETFQCSVCKKEFSSKNHLQRHKVVHSDTKPYHCPECNRGFTQSSNMETHRRIHSGDKPYTCDLCGETFRQNVALKTHKQKVHDIDVWNEKPTPCHVGRPTGTKTTESKSKKPKGKKAGGRKSGLTSESQAQIRLPEPLTIQQVPPQETQNQQSLENTGLASQKVSQHNEQNEKVQSEEKQTKDQESTNVQHQTDESVDRPPKNQHDECQMQPSHQEPQLHLEEQSQQQHPTEPQTSHHKEAEQKQQHHAQQLNSEHQQPQTEPHQQHQADQQHQEQPHQENQNHYPVATIELQRPNPVHQQHQVQRPPEDQYQQSKEQQQKDDNKTDPGAQQAHQQQQQSYQQENFGKVSQQYHPQVLHHQPPQPLQYQQAPQQPQHQHYQQREFATVQGRNNGPFPNEIRSYQRESITTSNFYSHYMQSSKISSGWSSSLPPPPSQPINPPPPLNRNNDPPTSHHMPMPLVQNNSPPSHRSTPGSNTHHHLQALLDMESNLGNGAPSRQAPVPSVGNTIQSPPPTPIQHSRSSPSPSPHEASRPSSKGPQFQTLFHSPQASPLSSTFPSNPLNLRPPMNNTIPSNYPIPCPSPRPLSPFFTPTGAPYQGATRDMISSQTQEPDHTHSAPSLRQWYMGPPDTGNQQAALALASMHYPAPMGAQPQGRMPYMGYSNAPMPFPLSGNPTPPSQQRWGH